MIILTQLCHEQTYQFPQHYCLAFCSMVRMDEERNPRATTVAPNPPKVTKSHLVPMRSPNGVATTKPNGAARPSNVVNNEMPLP